MRSAIFMSSVIFVLEIWLILRQTHKYIVPTLMNPANTASPFQVIFQNTSNFFLLMSMGFAMFIYSVMYVSKTKSVKKLVWVIIFAAFSLMICALLPLEFYYKSIKFTSEVNTIKGVFKILFYASVIFFDIGIIFATIYRYKGGRRASLSSVKKDSYSSSLADPIQSFSFSISASRIKSQISYCSSPIFVLSLALLMSSLYSSPHANQRMSSLTTERGISHLIFLIFTFFAIEVYAISPSGPMMGICLFNISGSNFY